jgi:hypothetical protein
LWISYCKLRTVAFEALAAFGLLRVIDRQGLVSILVIPEARERS